MLDQLYHKIQNHYGSNEPLVFGRGKRNAQVLLIGEAPGKDEVKNGRPFCGKAGQNLTEFLDAIELRREDIYITNVCKFRPTKVSEKGTVSNRTPTRREISAALPFLYEEIGIISPSCIVTLGNTPLRACMGDFSAVIGSCHGQAQSIRILDTPYTLFALYHPASVIYNRALRDTYLNDLQLLHAHLSGGRHTV